MIDSIRRYFIEITGIIISSFVVGLSFLLLTPPFLETKATLLLHDGPEEGLFTRAVEILQGNVLAEEVLNTLGAERLFPNMPQEQRLRQFQSQLQVEALEQSQIIHLTFRHREAFLALKTLEQVITSLVDTLERLHSSVQSLREGQVRTLLHQMQEAETALKVFQNQHSRTRLQSRTVELARQRNQLEAQIVVEEEQIKDSENRAADLRKKLQEGDQDVVAYRMELLRLQIYERQLQQKYLEEQGSLRRVREQIQRLQQEPHNPTIEALIQELVAVQLAINAREEQRDRAKRVLSQVIQQQQRLTAQAQVVEDLERAHAQSQEQYRLAQENMEAPGQEALRLTLLERPLLPPPARHWISLVGAVLAGALVSLAYVGLREFMRNKQ
jgi:chromosome segregation ATPase